MKTLKNLSVLFLSIIILASCSDDDTPQIVNEEEVITTFTATLTPNSGSGTTVTFKSFDEDGGDGPKVPVLSVTGELTASTTYNGSIVLLNETETPAEDITKEVEEEDKEHQFFFSATNSIATFEYSDTDGNGNPIGLKFKLVTGNAGTGDITFTLIHQPNKNASGVSDGNIANAGGETDFSETFKDVMIK